MKKFFLTLLLIISFVGFMTSLVIFTYPKPPITKMYLENGKLNIKFSINKYKINKNIYCYLSKEVKTPILSDENWIKTNDNVCQFDFKDDSYNLWVKNDKEIIYSYDSNNTKTLEFNVNYSKESRYLAKKGTFKIDYTYKSIGINENNIKWTSNNEKIATVSDGKVTGVSNGTAKISVNVDKETKSFEFVVTDLIVPVPKSFDFNKSTLACGEFTKEENDLEDKILKDRIAEAGYKTRAGAVEAARFLTLEFPYRISYFYENGRAAAYRTEKVDAEGRYYHIGLYLDESRYSAIKYEKYGPKTWGCKMYSAPVNVQAQNGLDCSGFVSWALLNAGFDVDDLGAGIASHADLTDTGKRTELTTTLAKSDKIKVGDLLFSYIVGGHIAMIVGMDSTNFYVAQAIWYGESGVVITKYSRSKIESEFDYAVLMDSYYKEDGNYTELWY